MLGSIFVEGIDVRRACCERTVRVLESFGEVDGDDVVDANVRGAPAAVVDTAVEPPLLAVRAGSGRDGLWERSVRTHIVIWGRNLLWASGLPQDEEVIRMRPSIAEEEPELELELELLLLLLLLELWSEELLLEVLLLDVVKAVGVDFLEVEVEWWVELDACRDG